MKHWKAIASVVIAASVSVASAQLAGKAGTGSQGHVATGGSQAQGPAAKIDTSNQSPVQRALWHYFISVQSAALQAEPSLATKQRIIVSTNLYMRGVLTDAQRKPYDASTWSPRNLTEARWRPVLTVPVMIDKLMQLTDKQLGEVKSAWLSNQANWDAFLNSVRGKNLDAAARAEAMMAHLSDMTDGISAVLSGPQRAEWQKLVNGFRQEILRASRGA